MHSDPLIMKKTVYIILLLVSATLAHQKAFGQTPNGFMLTASTEIAQQNGEAVISVGVRGFVDIVSTQFSMEWDPGQLEFVAVELASPNLLNLNLSQNFGVLNVANGHLTYSWYDNATQGITLADNTVIFKVHVKAIGAQGSYCPFSITGTPTGIEVFNVFPLELPVHRLHGAVKIAPAAASSLTLTSGHTLGSGCNNNHGSVLLSVSGGQLPYAYSWTGNGSYAANTEDISNLSEGVYNVTITDAQSGYLRAAFVVPPDNSDIEVLGINLQPAHCLVDDGQISFSVSGSSPPFTYLWSNGATTEDLTNLAGGTYWVTITDDTGCTVAHPFTIQTVSNLSVQAFIAQPNCNDDPATGDIELLVQGGVAPYSAQWSNGATGLQVTGLEPDVYAVTVSDVSGCSQINVFAINDNSTSNWVVSSQHTCNADSTGNLSVVLVNSDALPPIQFAWSTGQTGEIAYNSAYNWYGDTLYNLPSGLYSLTISDAGGCEKVMHIVMDCTNPAPPSDCFALTINHVTTTPGDTVCMPITTKGFSDIVGIQFGIAWDSTVLDFVDVQSLNWPGFNPSNYFLDGDNLRLSWLDPSLNGLFLSDGETALSVCFAVRPNAPGNQTTVSFSDENLTYEVVQSNGIGMESIIGFNGINGVITYGPGAPPPLILDACNTNANCSNDGNATVNLFVFGNTTPYFLNWETDGGQFTGTEEDLLALSPGQYTITVTDLDGHSATAVFEFPVLTSSECVWPGDADNNDVSNHYDLLYVGLGYGSQGEIRLNNTANWMGLDAYDWAQQTPERNVNFKNIDTNGDGLVSDSDTMAIVQNWGKVIRPFYDDPEEAPTGIPPTGMGPVLYVPQDTLDAGAAAEIPVFLGTLIEPVQDIYGLAFSIQYDPAVIKPNQVHFALADNCWLGNAGNLLMVQRNAHVKGRIDIAIVRKDGAPVSGFGTIGSLYIVIEDDIFALNRPGEGGDFGPTDSLVATIFRVNRILAINEVEEVLDLSGQETHMYLKKKTISAHAAGDLSGKIVLAPNPVDDELHIEVLEAPVEAIQVFSAAGVMVKSAMPIASNRCIMPVRDLPAGSYFIKIITENGTGLRPITIQH